MARLLIADQEHHILKVLEFRFQRLGHEVMVVTNGEGALEIATSERPDLVMLDMMMPNMGALEVLHKLKSQDETKKIPVILLTAVGRDETLVSGLDAGATDYVTKPFEFGDLIARVDRALGLQH